VRSLGTRAIKNAQQLAEHLEGALYTAASPRVRASVEGKEMSCLLDSGAEVGGVRKERGEKRFRCTMVQRNFQSVRILSVLLGTSSCLARTLKSRYFSWRLLINYFGLGFSQK
jgi:hypothetical protein